MDDCCFRLNDCDGSQVNFNEYMTAVGWGVLDGVQYYIIKTAWGDDFGMDGYVNIATSDDDLGPCGVNAWTWAITI